MICNACDHPAAIIISDSHSLCVRCHSIMLREYPNFAVDSSSLQNEAAVTTRLSPQPKLVTAADFPELPAFLDRRRRVA
jgi:hypothetical protein